MANCSVEQNHLFRVDKFSNLQSVEVDTTGHTGAPLDLIVASLFVLIDKNAHRLTEHVGCFECTQHPVLGA